MFVLQVVIPGVLVVALGGYAFKLVLDELSAFIDDMKGSD